MLILNKIIIFTIMIITIFTIMIIIIITMGLNKDCDLLVPTHDYLGSQIIMIMRKQTVSYSTLLVFLSFHHHQRHQYYHHH